MTHNNALDFGTEGGFTTTADNSTQGEWGEYVRHVGIETAWPRTWIQLGGPAGFRHRGRATGRRALSSPQGDYQATLRAIATAGKTEVLSRPSITARNNQPATITVGQSVPLITNVRYDNFGSAINSVTYTDVGIILRVTPFISNDGMVEMIVSPEISSLTDQTVPIANGVNVPVIAKLLRRHRGRHADGHPVIIGGMMRDNKLAGGRFRY